MILLARVKRLIVRYLPRLGERMIEFCHECGRTQPLTWMADDALWAKAMRRTDGGGIRCPECFDALARKNGVGIVYWTASERQGAGIRGVGTEEV